MYLKVWSTDSEDFKMINVRNNQLNLNLVYICLDTTLQMLCKSLLCFAKIWRIDYTKKSPKFDIQNLECSTKNSISLSVFNRFHQQSSFQNLS